MRRVFIGYQLNREARLKRASIALIRLDTILRRKVHKV